MTVAVRALGGLAALAGMVAFACHFAVPVDVGTETITPSEATATYRNVGVAGQLLLLAALGLVAAIRPAVGARVVALGAVALPWLVGGGAQLWADDAPGVVRVGAAAVLLGLVVVGVAGLLGLREVRWSAGGVLLGDGVAALVAVAALWGLLGVNWYRVRDLTTDAVFDARFGALLDTSTGAGRLTWVATAVAGLALVAAVGGGGWGRRVAGAVIAGACLFEVLRRVFVTGDRLIPPADRANPFGASLSGEPVLGILVLPLVGVAAGAWFLTTDGEPAPGDPVETGGGTGEGGGGTVEPVGPVGEVGPRAQGGAVGPGRAPDGAAGPV